MLFIGSGAGVKDRSAYHMVAFTMKFHSSSLSSCSLLVAVREASAISDGLDKQKPFPLDVNHINVRIKPLFCGEGYSIRHTCNNNLRGETRRLRVGNPSFHIVFERKHYGRQRKSQGRVPMLYSLVGRLHVPKERSNPPSGPVLTQLAPRSSPARVEDHVPRQGPLQAGLLHRPYYRVDMTDIETILVVHRNIEPHTDPQIMRATPHENDVLDRHLRGFVLFP